MGESKWKRMVSHSKIMSEGLELNPGSEGKELLEEAILRRYPGVYAPLFGFSGSESLFRVMVLLLQRSFSSNDVTMLVSSLLEFPLLARLLLVVHKSVSHELFLVLPA